MRHAARRRWWAARRVDGGQRVMYLWVGHARGLGQPVVGREMPLCDRLLRKLVGIKYCGTISASSEALPRQGRRGGDCAGVGRAGGAYRVFGDDVERIADVDLLTGEILGLREQLAIPGEPLCHQQSGWMLIRSIREELDAVSRTLARESCWRRALEQRTSFDLEMSGGRVLLWHRELLRHLAAGTRAARRQRFLTTSRRHLMFIDESHGDPALRASAGDRSRKETLVKQVQATVGLRQQASYI